MKQQFEKIISILNSKEKQRFFFLVLLDLVVSILDIAFIIALLFVIGFYTKTYQDKTLLFLPAIFFDKNPLLLISAFFVLFSFKNILSYQVTRMQFRFIYQVASRISKANLEHYLHSNFAEYVSIDSSVQIRKISQQPIEFCHHVLRGVQVILSNIILLIVTIIPIFIFNHTLTLLLFLVLIPPVFLTTVFAKRKLATIRSAGKLNMEKALQHVQEAISGFIEINVFNQKEFFIKRYIDFQQKFNASLAELQVVQALPSKLMEVFAVFGLFILVTATTIFHLTSSMHVLLIGGFMAAAYKIIPGVVKILNSWEQIKTYTFTIDELLETKLYVNDEIPAVETLEKIECNNLSFFYKETRVLNDISFNMQRGDLVGLSGISGVGKTTLINLLLGFISPASGEIIFNGKPVDELERKSFWNKISYSRQDPYFIHESILTNIVFGNSVDENRLKRILRLTGVDKFNIKMEGADLLLAENGKNISGGQRQRLIMARTLYKDADLYIFDEPFNELDKLSSTQLLSHLQELASAGKMVLLVTHDKELLDFCNKKISLGEK